MGLRQIKYLIASLLVCLSFSEFLLLQIADAGPVKPKIEEIFTFRIRDEPETLDWNKAHTTVEAYILMNIMEGLVSLESGSQVTPALAQSWKVSEDQRTYTFKLRPQVKWSDGVALKAQDFVYSWKRLLSPLTAASYSYLLYDIENAESFNKGTIKDFNQVGVKAKDDLTLEVRLSHPVAHWIYIPGFWVTFPMRQDIVETSGVEWEKPGKMVNIGPFSLVSHEIDSKIVLEVNPYYYRDHGNVDRIVARIVKDDQAALNLYEAGKIDFLSDLATVDLKRLGGRPDLRKFSHFKTGYLGFQPNRFPISNLKLRRAIAMAIDKKKLCSVLFGGQQPATSFVPPPLMAYSAQIGLPYDPIQARAELRNSGLVSTDTLTIDYILPNWDKSMIIAQNIQEQLKKNLDLKIVLRPFDNKSYRNQLDLHLSPLFDYTWTADYPDPDNFLSVYLSDSGNSRTTWKSEQFDQLVKQARQASSPKEREKIYITLQKNLIEEEAVLVPLYYEPNLALVRPHAKNFELNPLDYLYLRKVDIVP